MDHMCKEPFEILWWPVLALIGLIANSSMNVLPSALATWGFATVVVAGYLHYVMTVIDDICGFLGIHCLKIKQAKA